MTDSELKYAERVRGMIYNAGDILETVKQMETLLAGNITNQKRDELRQMCNEIRKSYVKIVCP